MLNFQAQASSVAQHSAPAAQVATFNGGAWIDVRSVEGDLLFVQSVGAVSGTAPTLDGKLQDATDAAGTGAADISGATFTQVTASNSVQKRTVQAKATRGFVRYTGTIAGTTPSFTTAVIELHTLKSV